MAKADATRALGGSKKKPRITDMHIRPTANGGYIAQHTMAAKNENDPMTGSAPKEYGLSDKAALMAHMDQHLPDDSAPDDEDPAAAAATAS